MSGWALDLGTTDSSFARWDEEALRPRLVELPAICRAITEEGALEAPAAVVPSAVEALPPGGFVDRVGRWPLVSRRFFLGRQAWIGRAALERNRDEPRPSFVPHWKAALLTSPLRTVARLGRRGLSAREIAALYLRELLAEAQRTTGERPRALTVTVPVDSYDRYRSELSYIAGRNGIARLRFLDEPVAAALGYGLGSERPARVLVFDMGGGTLHLVLVELSPRGAAAGHGNVLAKESRPLGGNVVDGWVLDWVAERLGWAVPSADTEDWSQRLWRRLMLAEACRVKERVHFDPSALFSVAPPGLARPALVELTQDGLRELLERRGLYAALEQCLQSVGEQAGRAGAALEQVDDVLMVGGSSLLPGVYPFFERRFGRDRVRAWQPFEAVAYGAAAFAAERLSQSDFIVHDYAFVTHERGAAEPRYQVIVPRGTRFPTAPDFWKRQLVPTCALGEPERMFKLVVCELGRGEDGERRFAWDGAGTLRQLDGGAGKAERLVVPLNETSPTLGTLDPPHQPDDRRPRLEISFGVNADRWLIASAFDLLRQRRLMDEQPVVRLL